MIILLVNSSTAVVSAMSLFSLYRDHRTLREISMGGHMIGFCASVGLLTAGLRHRLSLEQALLRKAW